ncbi:MAG: DUF6528 family protein [Limisphaerales bacterium]
MRRRLFHWLCLLTTLVVLAREAENRPSPDIRPAPARLLLCGMDEVFVVDAAMLTCNGPVTKLWSWRAKDREELPAGLRGAFGTTDECKPVSGGRQILITSSGGGCALVDYPSGAVRWHGRAHNAHSAELLPNHRVVVAASVGAAGNRLLVFDLARPGEPLTEASLESAHGVIWDEARQCLWALGFSTLEAYELRDWQSQKPTLQRVASHPLPDPDGHDLQAVPGSDDLLITTGAKVFLFDRNNTTFRPHPELRDREHVKSVSIHPATGRVVFVQAEAGRWWSGTLRFLNPAAETALTGERIYKARWFLSPSGTAMNSTTGDQPLLTEN